MVHLVIQPKFNKMKYPYISFQKKFREVNYELWDICDYRGMGKTH